jgi:hypothetical protein
MKRLLGVENIDGRISKDWLHVGDDGRDRITTETTQDVEPIIRATKQMSDAQIGRRGFMRFQANIPSVLLEDMCKAAAIASNQTTKEVFEEVMLGKTDRAQRIIRTLTEGRDFRKLQAEKDAPRFVTVNKPDSEPPI